MGLRSVLAAWILTSLVWAESEAASPRMRRSEEVYQPLLGPPPRHNSYQPPIPLGRSIDSVGRASNAIHEITPSAATSYSVHQQHHEGALLSSGDTHSKAISHAPLQAIHKAPASEIQSEKAPAAKDKDNKNDEYVVYYYYYYDNDTSPNNNLSLNFDDIPSLEVYDEDKNPKEPQRSASARSLAANINSLVPSAEGAPQSSSQPRSASGLDKEIKADRYSNNFQDSVVQPLKPVSNIYRYGANEVPRFPVLPNFVISEVPTTAKSVDVVTHFPAPLEHSTTQQPPSLNSQFPNLNSNEEEDDAVNNVLDNASELKPVDDKSSENDVAVTTVSTTDAPTTTEFATTTTEKSSRRRPSIGGGGRRRFNASPSSFTSSRTRAPARNTTASTTSTTTTTTSTPTRRSFQGGSSRTRSRPSISSNRGRTGSRTTESSDEASSQSSESTTVSTSTARSRFTSGPRRFQSSRSRSQTSSSTTTARSPTSAAPPPVRSRPTSRPKPQTSGLISRNRPPRPGFLRPRPGSEPEVAETTTTPEPEEASPPQNKEEEPSGGTDNESFSESEETSPEEPTTTEANRFSALFRPRNRSALGNRPRPVAGNRPPRS